MKLDKYDICALMSAITILFFNFKHFELIYMML